jgi:hypothetical protein
MSELEDKVKELGITVTAKHNGAVISDNDKVWSHDKWEVVLSYKGKEMSTSYKTGLGHRKPAYPTTVKNGIYSGPKGNVRTVEAAAKMGYTKPVTPNVADVVYSLMVDATGTDLTFEDWCYDIGYDTDSRKALDMYLKCQENSKKIRNLLGADFESLVGLEH